MRVPIRSDLDFVFDNPVYDHDSSVLDLSHASTEVWLLLRQRGGEWSETEGDADDDVTEIEADITINGADQEAVAVVANDFWVDETNVTARQWERRWRVVNGANGAVWYSPEWIRFTVG